MTISPDNRLAHIEKQIASLEKDVSIASRLADKVEITLEKMTEVTNSIRQLLAVHDSEIRAHHETDLDLYQTIEARRKDDLIRHKDVIELIDKGIRSVHDQVRALEYSNDAKFANCSTIAGEHDRRIRGLERITFIGLGLAMLAGIIADKIPWDNLI